MLLNYFKIAWRNFVRDKQFSFLNLLGLSTGLACVILIYLWVSDETKMDKFLQNDDRIYQVMQNFPDATGNIMTTEHTQAILADAMKRELPEVEDAAILRYPGEDEEPNGIIKVDKKYLKAHELYASSNLLSVFSYQLLEGNPKTAMQERMGVLISDRLAEKLFHTTKGLIGKTITWDRGDTYAKKLNGDYIIKGVIQAPPSNASIQFDIVFNWDHYMDLYKEQYGLTTWGSSNPFTFLLLKKGTDVNAFNKKIAQFIREKWKAVNGTNDLKYIGTIFVQRYSERYLYNRSENGVIAGGRIDYVRLFSIIAIFILVIACINFMNLATAKASRRMKEVGVRKVIGARRASLIFQYISESMLMSVLSTVIALLLVSILLPAFKAVTGKELVLPTDFRFIGILALITVLTGLIAGSYPAFYLSHFKPGSILKGSMKMFSGESWVRKGLVVFQFSISVLLIVSVMIVYLQMKLIQTKNLGYSKENILLFSSDGELQRNTNAFQTALRQIPSIKYATTMEGDLMGNHSGGGGINWPGKDHPVEFSGFYADFDFMESLDVKMKEGRALSRAFGDSNSVVFNDAAIQAMGLKDPIGKTVELWGAKRQIVGIVNDFHFESLYKKVGPLFITWRPNGSTVMVKMRAGQEKQAIAQIEKLYKAFNNGLPLEYRFMDDDYQKMYQSELKVSTLSKWFAGVAILISCLGLFGLAAFTAQKREKEIGIRKVIGASVSNIAVLLSRDFLKLVVISICIAFPVAWWAANRWLDSFAYRIHPQWWIFAGSALAVMLITILTVSSQSIRAAMANPVKALRSE